MNDEIDVATIRLARWAAKNCPDSLEEESEIFLRFDEKRGGSILGSTDHRSTSYLAQWEAYTVRKAELEAKEAT